MPGTQWVWRGPRKHLFKVFELVARGANEARLLPHKVPNDIVRLACIESKEEMYQKN